MAQQVTNSIRKTAAAEDATVIRRTPTVLERALRAGLSAALIAPTVFVSAGYANADEAAGNSSQEVQGRAEGGAPATASEALDALAEAERLTVELQADYEAAEAGSAAAAEEAAAAESRLAQAESRAAEAEAALSRAEE